VENLWKRYGKKVILRDITFTIDHGTVVGLLGPNGAGKSTILKIITGLVYPTSGYVMINGWNIRQEYSSAMNSVGALIEKPRFYNYLTAEQNLKLLSRVKGYPNLNILKLLECVSLHESSRIRVKEFSQGMRQRLGIAQTLIGDPDLLILDEPTNGLDPASIIQIRELIGQLRTHNITILLSSHILGEVVKVCDYIMFIRHGEIFQYRGQKMFSIEEIKTSDTLESIFLDLIHE